MRFFDYISAIRMRLIKSTRVELFYRGVYYFYVPG